MLYRDDDFLEVTKRDLIIILKDNLDKSPENEKILDTLIGILVKYDTLTPRQYDWICHKLLYVIRHNDKYREYRGVRGFHLTPRELTDPWELDLTGVLNNETPFKELIPKRTN
jgi:hypothetical protein